MMKRFERGEERCWNVLKEGGRVLECVLKEREKMGGGGPTTVSDPISCS